MKGLNEKDMQAVINTYDLKPYYYPTLFPFKENYTLTWKALETQVGLKIAADLVARGATVDKKTREAIARIQGDINTKRTAQNQALYNAKEAARKAAYEANRVADDASRDLVQVEKEEAPSVRRSGRRRSLQKERGRSPRRLH